MIKKKYIKILDKNIAYFDEGHGDNLIFIHGNPTSSYLWRNIIHSLKLKYRCIAPDLIGMGDSDKLNNVSNQSYSFFEHKKWLNEFIDNLNLEKKFHLVLHDWGSALGFDYAKENEDKISGIVYMEAIVCPLEWKDWPENARNIFKLLRGKAGEDLIYNKNIFIEKILPSSIIRDLSEQEMQEYKKPYLCGGYHRQPTLSWPRQIPLGGKPENINKLVYNYAEFMKETNIKKLFINAKPGSILVGRQRNFCRTWKNQKEVTVKGIHFIQEDSPNEISYEIDLWLKETI
tara:strand:- start:391 stop:1254 length:864 start_codon:yes stop_codon:yes gene_type:complete